MRLSHTLLTSLALLLLAVLVRFDSAIMLFGVSTWLCCALWFAHRLRPSLKGLWLLNRRPKPGDAPTLALGCVGGIVCVTAIWFAAFGLPMIQYLQNNPSEENFIIASFGLASWFAAAAFVRLAIGRTSPTPTIIALTATAGLALAALPLQVISLAVDVSRYGLDQNRVMSLLTLTPAVLTGFVTALYFYWSGFRALAVNALDAGSLAKWMLIAGIAGLLIMLVLMAPIVTSATADAGAITGGFYTGLISLAWFTVAIIWRRALTTSRHRIWLASLIGFGSSASFAPLDVLFDAGLRAGLPATFAFPFILIEIMAILVTAIFISMRHAERSRALSDQS